LACAYGISIRRNENFSRCGWYADADGCTEINASDRGVWVFTNLKSPKPERCMEHGKY